MIDVKAGENVLLFRVNPHVKKDSIECHKRTLFKYNYCWFGKIGRVPKFSKIEELLKQDNPHMLIYNKKQLYLCDIDEICYEKPEEGYPEFYVAEFFNKGVQPNCYLRIKKMVEIDVKELDRFYVLTTAKSAAETLPTAKATFMFLVYDDIPVIEKKTRVKKVIKVEHDTRSCKYKVDGNCENRKCINYRYECIRPEYCIKRKN